MANIPTLDAAGKVVPKDLAISAQPDVDKDYFDIQVTGLKVDQTYSFQFQWIYEDGEVSNWSPGYQLTTATENVPSAPSVTVPSTSVGNIPVTLTAFPANARRVDIYVIGGIYGTGKVVDSFLAAGTKTISITEPGVYQVVLIAVTPSGINGDPTNTFTITVSASTVDTTVIPGAPSSIVVNGYNETSDPLNRTGYANISWTAGSGVKGYAVGLWTSTPGSTDPIRVIPADGTSVKVNGLFVGSSYYFKVRSFNEFNNPSAWVAPSSNYPVTIPANSAIPGKVTISGIGTPKSIVATWTIPALNADLVTAGGYYVAKLYENSGATGSPLQTINCYSNITTFAGLTTGSSYYITVQAYTSGVSATAGTLSDIYGPFVPTSVEPADIQANFILANNQFQVGNSGTTSDVHLSAYPKTVGGVAVKGRIYIGASETSISDPTGLYNSSGTPFYADDTGRFSLGDKLTWSGGALNVKGTIDVTGPSTFSSYVLAGSTASEFIGIGYQVPNRLANVLKTGINGISGIVINKADTGTSDYIKSDGTFSLADGALTFTGGVLTATGTITATALASDTTITGTIINAGIFQTSTTTGNGSTAGIKINTSGIFGYTASSSTPNFSVTNTGVLTALSGTIGGWKINSTQLRSNGANQISLNQGTPKIALITGATLNGTTGLYEGGVEKITIDPVDGIKDSAGKFSLTPNGVLIINGSITSGSTITGTQITGSTLTTAASGRRVEIITSGINFYDANAGNSNGSINASGHAFYITAPGDGSTDANVQIYGGNAGASNINTIWLWAGPTGGSSNAIQISPSTIRRNGNVGGGGNSNEFRNITAQASSSDLSGVASDLSHGSIWLNYT